MEDTEGPNGKYPPLIPPTISDFVPPHTYAEEVKTVVSASSWTNVTMSVDCNPVANLQESIITEFSAGVVAQGSEGQVFFTGPPGLPVGAELFPTGTAGYWVIIEGLTPGRHTVSVSATFINPYFNYTGSKCTSMHTESICVSNTPRATESKKPAAVASAVASAVGHKGDAAARHDHVDMGWRRSHSATLHASWSTCPRSGRKKACGAVEQKKAPKQGRKHMQP
jgi:hypothetical protein